MTNGVSSVIRRLSLPPRTYVHFSPRLARRSWTTDIPCAAQTVRISRSAG